MSLYRSAPLFSLRDVFGEALLWAEHVGVRDHVGTLPREDRSYTTWYMRWHRPKGDLFDLPYSARLCYGDREICIVSTVRLQLKYILDQYNYDASNGMYNYSCTRYFSDLKLTVA